MTDGYRDEVAAIETESGFKVGFEEGQALVTSGKIIDLIDLAKVHELGSPPVVQRPHFLTVWRRFEQRFPEVASRIRQRVKERMAESR